MQKKLIALAIVGLASTAAFAQTNVTLYGVADVTLESVKTSDGGPMTTAANANYGNTGRVTSNSSYVGLKSKEDLGNGLNALFQFETYFNADTGVYSGSGRDTFVGLSSNDFGTIVAGNLTGATRALGNRMEMLPGNTGVGTAVSLLGNPLNAGNIGTTGTFDTRFHNTVAYMTRDYNGLNFMVDYSFGENKQLEDGTGAGTQNGTKTWEIGVNYVNSGWDLGYVYGKVDTGDNIAGNVDEVKNHRLGLGYTFDGGHKVTFQWDRQEFDAVGGGELKQNSYSLQGKYMVTPAGGLIADYTVAKDLDMNGTQSDTGAKMITVGWLQNLSKRTMVKAVYSRISNDDNVAYNFSTGAVGTATNTSAEVLAAISGGPALTKGFGPGADVSAFAVGVRHSF